MNKSVLIRTDGITVEVEHVTAPPLRFLQESVGGHIELVPFFTKYKGRNCKAFCNGDRKLPVNDYATKAAGMVLVGDVIILVGDDDFLSKAGDRRASS